MKACEHEYENANCTNCANGLPSSGYECANTKGTLKEYVHKKAEEIHRLKYNEGYEQGYEQGRADAIDKIESKVAEWHGLSQDGWIPCQQVIDFCEGIGEEE